MMPSPNHVPDWLLERLAAGELPASQANRLRERLAETGQTDRLAALAASNADIFQAYPAEQVAAEVQRRAKRAEISRSRSWTRPVWGLSMAAAGVATILVVVYKPVPVQGPMTAETERPAPVQDPMTAETVLDDGRPKGLTPSLRLYRQKSDGVERLGPGSRLRPGDLVQVRYLAAARPYGVVASMDARGSVTLHLPEKPGPAASLIRDGERVLPHAYELDASPGFERFVFVTADTTFDTEVVVKALKEGVALPKGLNLWSVTLPKEGK